MANTGTKILLVILLVIIGIALFFLISSIAHKETKIENDLIGFKEGALDSPVYSHSKNSGRYYIPLDDDTNNGNIPNDENDIPTVGPFPYDPHTDIPTIGPIPLNLVHYSEDDFYFNPVHHYSGPVHFSWD